MTELAGLDRALWRLSAALNRLESQVARKMEDLRDQADLEDEIQRLNNDRAALAEALDKEKAQVSQLSDLNSEVSHRLVSAMENIRSILERQDS